MRERLLRFLRVPERPEPPPGAGDELETFRATRGFFHYSILMWFPKQIAAFTGLLFSLSFFGAMGGSDWDFIDAAAWDRVMDKIGEADIGLAWLRFDLTNIILFFEALAIGAFAAQLIFTGLFLKLSWELRWYMVGERSLRLRHGLWKVREQTMSVANIQNMIVRQGPLMRFFGFSDLEVHTAGGGSGGSSNEDPTQQKDSFHVGRFRGLENASVLRDKIRARIQVVQSGKREPMAVDTVDEPGDLAGAAQELLGEARALRRAVSGER
ncbi:MAG: PH domain-containing protein [Thermoanaerobaculia bacterium]